MVNRKRSNSGRNTKGTNMPEVPAGTIKAIPKRGESPKDAVARVEARNPGKRVVDPPAYGGGGRSARGNYPGAIVTKQFESTQGIVHIPEPKFITGYTGSRFATDLFRDRGLTAKRTLYLINCNQQLTTWGLQFPVAAPATEDTIIGPTTAMLMNELYSTVVRLLYSKSRIALRDTVLDVPGAYKAASNMQLYLTTWCNAYGSLRSLEGLYRSGFLNDVTQAIASVIHQVWPRLESALERLYTFSMPKGWYDLMDHVCGPKAYDENSPAFCYMWSAGGPPLDLTVLANVQTVLTTAEANVGNLNALSGTSQDLLRISNVFANAYENVGYVPAPKTLSFSPTELCAMLSMCYQYTDTTSAKNFLWPNVNSPVQGNVIPILVPKNVSDDEKAFLASLWRGGVYSPEPIAGVGDTVIPNIVGFIGNSNLSTNGTQFISYDQNGIATATTSSGAGIANVVYSSNEEAFWWAPLAENETSDYIFDRRSYDYYDVHWVSRDSLLNETVNLWNAIWYTGLM